MLESLSFARVRHKQQSSMSFNIAAHARRHGLRMIAQLRLAPDDLLRDRTYRRLWTSILISSFGGQVTMLALPLTAAVLPEMLPLPTIQACPPSGAYTYHAATITLLGRISTKIPCPSCAGLYQAPV